MAPAKFQLANLLMMKDSYWSLLEMSPSQILLGIRKALQTQHDQIWAQNHFRKI